MPPSRLPAHLRFRVAHERMAAAFRTCLACPAMIVLTVRTPDFCPSCAAKIIQSAD